MGKVFGILRKDLLVGWMLVLTNKGEIEAEKAGLLIKKKRLILITIIHLFNYELMKHSK